MKTYAVTNFGAPTYKGLCVGGPKDGQFAEFYMKCEGIFSPGIPGKSKPKMLGWYHFSKKAEQTFIDFFIWEEAKNE